jgi:hypothetical protein
MDAPPQLSLALIKKPSFLDKAAILCEIVPVENIRALLLSDKLRQQFNARYHSTFENEKQQLEKYLAAFLSKLSAVPVTYKKTAKHDYGRVYPVQGIGATAMAKKRGTPSSVTSITTWTCPMPIQPSFVACAKPFPTNYLTHSLHNIATIAVNCSRK